MMEVGINLKVLVNNKTSLLILICIISWGCRRNDNSSFEKKQIVSNTTLVNKMKIEEIIPDSVINNVLKLRNCLSFEAFYPEFEKVSLVETIREGGPIAIFSNSDKTEYLLTYKYEGDVKYSFSCFEIGYWADESFDTLINYKVNCKKFSTESGIMLGVTLDSLIKIKGHDYRKQVIRGDTFISFEIIDYEHSTFLGRYDMPSYFMKYLIKDNVIQNIKFGFDYP